MGPFVIFPLNSAYLDQLKRLREYIFSTKGFLEKKTEEANIPNAPAIPQNMLAPLPLTGEQKQALLNQSDHRVEFSVHLKLVLELDEQ